MKKLSLLILSIGLCFIVACSSNSKSDAWEPNTPPNAASLAKFYVEQDNFDQFKKLVSKSFDENQAKQFFDTLKSVSSPSAGIHTYSLVTFDNGNSVFIEYLNSDHDEYYIQNIIPVPEELNNFINDANN